jgi:hypothetical protein
MASTPLSIASYTRSALAISAAHPMRRTVAGNARRWDARVHHAASASGSRRGCRSPAARASASPTRRTRARRARAFRRRATSRAGCASCVPNRRSTRLPRRAVLGPSRDSGDAAARAPAAPRSAPPARRARDRRRAAAPTRRGRGRASHRARRRSRRPGATLARAWRARESRAQDSAAGTGAPGNCRSRGSSAVARCP